MFYTLHNNGRIKVLSKNFIPNGLELPDNINVSDFENYIFSFDDGKWINTKIDYQYIIIPTDLIQNIKSMVQLVDDVLTDQAFVINLSKEEIITRNNQRRDIGILPISFTPCTVIEWENGDDARLSAIIKQFNNEYNPPRAIDFPCKFDSLQDFETFKQNYCYI